MQAPRLRLCFVSHSLPPLDRPLESVGGIQRVNADLLNAMATHADVALHPVIVRGAWSQRHWRVPIFLGDAWRTVSRLASRREIDAVLFSSLVTGALALPLGARLRRMGVPSGLIAYGHDVTMPMRAWQALVPRILRSMSVVLPISTATAQACMARGLPPQRCAVVPLGVDVTRFAWSLDRDQARQSLARSARSPIDGDTILLCSVGRQIPRKGFAWFVDEVMPRLPARVHYWLAGDGPERAHIESVIARHALGDRVRLLGRVSDAEVAQLYAAADLFVMPNVPIAGDMEGFGLVLLEAGVSGLPSIAAALEGITDVVTEGANGHLVPSRNAAAFAEHIVRYTDDRAALARFRLRAREHTLRTFGWNATISRYVEQLRARQSYAGPFAL